MVGIVILNYPSQVLQNKAAEALSFVKMGVLSIIKT